MKLVEQGLFSTGNRVVSLAPLSAKEILRLPDTLTIYYLLFYLSK